MIEVKKTNEQMFTVIVSEKGGSTEHCVTVDERYYENLTAKKITKKELITWSFEFLLAREPKESILPEFNLKLISRYFPEFETEIKSRL